MSIYDEISALLAVQQHALIVSPRRRCTGAGNTTPIPAGQSAAAFVELTIQDVLRAGDALWIESITGSLFNETGTELLTIEDAFFTFEDNPSNFDFMNFGMPEFTTLSLFSALTFTTGLATPLVQFEDLDAFYRVASGGTPLTPDLQPIKLLFELDFGNASAAPQNVSVNAQLLYRLVRGVQDG